MWPFSQGELEGRPEGFVDAAFRSRLPQPKGRGERRRTLESALVRGGFPEPATRASDADRMAWFAGYATTILQREVRDLANIDGLAALPRLLALVGARATTLLNTAELGRSAGIPNTTLKRYLALLQATFVAQLLPAWSANLGKRLVRSPKVMLCDTGLLAHLLGADARRVAADRGLLGPLLENLVAMELVKQAAWSEARPAPYHFRSHGGEDATRGVSAGLASPASGRAPSQARQGNVKRPVTRQRRYSAPASARASRPGLSSARPGAANPPGHHSP